MSETKKFLVVDDSEIIRKTIKNFLTGADVELLFSINGLDGIQKSAAHKPDLIILDLMMPDLDGIKMLQVIKLLEDTKKIPVIVISANTERNNILAAIKAGADKVISKPLQRDILFKAINEILGYKFLRSNKENDYFTELEKIQLKKELLKVFLDDFKEKEEKINIYIQQKNNEELAAIVHNFKGAGNTIGHPKISEISGELENHLLFSNIDWSSTSLKFELLAKYITSLNKEE